MNYNTENENNFILIAEDSSTQAQEIQFFLENNGYEVVVTSDGQNALEWLENNNKIPEVIVSDIVMPRMDGYQFCKAVRKNERFSKIPFILLTSLSEPYDIIKSIEAGANKFLTKPFNHERLLKVIDELCINMQRRKKSKMENGIELIFGGNDFLIKADTEQILDLLLSSYEDSYYKNLELQESRSELERLNANLEEKVQERTKELRKNLVDTVKLIASTVELRDAYTAGHQRRVAVLAKKIAIKLELNEDKIEGLLLASQIHDIGKIKVPAEILTKPSQLSNLEYELVKTHAEAGYQLLKEINFPWQIATIIRQHHEKLDGSGYPLGLHKDEILQEAQILTVADIVESMASHRPYRAALGIEIALEEIMNERGVKLDSLVVDACFKVFEEGFVFPLE